MPLPLIPLIIAGATAASAAIAGKKGYDSYGNMKETKSLALELEIKYKSAYNDFETNRNNTNYEFEEYGLLKLEVLDGSMKDFIETFKQIKNIDFKGETVIDNFSSRKSIEEFILNIERQVVQAGQVMTAGVASIAGGGLAAMGAVGVTTTFAAASTGTAIASLSGIAAQNATLAFFGGGALSAGGLGMAGGAIVLGGIALAPVLVISSLIFAASTKKKLEEMYAKRAEVNTEVEKLKSAVNVMQQISDTTRNMYDLAESTSILLLNAIEKMKIVIYQKGINYKNYSVEEQKIIHNNYKLATIMRDILNTTILNDEGELTPNIQSVITAERQNLSAVKEY